MDDLVSLPPELLVRIFSCLDAVRDLHSLSLVCVGLSWVLTDLPLRVRVEKNAARLWLDAAKSALVARSPRAIIFHLGPPLSPPGTHFVHIDPQHKTTHFIVAREPAHVYLLRNRHVTKAPVSVMTLAFAGQHYVEVSYKSNFTGQPCAGVSYDLELLEQVVIAAEAACILDVDLPPEDLAATLLLGQPHRYSELEHHLHRFSLFSIGCT